jgi:hypothetical protein
MPRAASLVLTERLEHMRQKIGADALAGVRHDEHSVSSRAVQPHRHPTCPRRELDGIGSSTRSAIVATGSELEPEYTGRRFRTVSRWLLEKIGKTGSPINTRTTILESIKSQRFADLAEFIESSVLFSGLKLANTPASSLLNA